MGKVKDLQQVESENQTFLADVPDVKAISKWSIGSCSRCWRRIFEHAIDKVSPSSWKSSTHRT